jgi:hypothetical protein
MFPRTHMTSVPTVVAAIALVTGLAAGLTACAGAAAQPARSDPPGVTGTGATGTGATGGVGIGAATAPVIVRAAARRVRCPAIGLPTEPVPAGFAPVAVVECVRVSVAVPGGGAKIEEKREVAVGWLSALVHALRQPSAPRKGLQLGCMVPVFAVPWLELIDRTGQVIHPEIPVGVCGLPVVPVQTSLRSLRWVSLGVSPALPMIEPSTAPSDELVTGQRPPIEGGPVHRLTPGSSASSPAG